MAARRLQLPGKSRSFVDALHRASSNLNCFYVCYRLHSPPAPEPAFEHGPRGTSAVCYCTSAYRLLLYQCLQTCEVVKPPPADQYVINHPFITPMDIIIVGIWRTSINKYKHPSNTLFSKGPPERFK